MRKLLARNRIALNKELRTIEQRSRFSPALLAMHRTLEPVLRENVRGCFLDIGCGEVPFRKIISEHVSEYLTFDVEQRTGRLDFTGDVQNMDMVPDEGFDSAGCFGVLEHVRDPARAAREMARILKPGGTLVITAPFMARLHEEPRDYYRYTCHGMRHLFEAAGLTTVSIRPVGGLFSFLGHQIATLWVCSTWHLPVIRTVVFQLNRFTVVKGAVLLDRILQSDRVLPAGYAGVFIKPDGQQSG